jgi:carnosine N-methyltransferase
MIDALLAHSPNESRRGNIRVLIPGAGLARLGWEVANLGESCTSRAIWLLTV